MKVGNYSGREGYTDKGSGVYQWPNQYPKINIHWRIGKPTKLDMNYAMLITYRWFDKLRRSTQLTNNSIAMLSVKYVKEKISKLQ